MTTTLTDARRQSNELLDITPQMAREWLETTNTHNRNIAWDFVGNLADQIKAGDWQLDGNAIKFGWATAEFIAEMTLTIGPHDIKEGDMVLLDGQHRLLAVIEAGIAVPSYVIHGLEPKAQMVMDTGRRRSLGDQLKLRGEKNTQQLASAITRIHLTRIGEQALRNPSRFRPSVAQALLFLEREPQIRDVVRHAARVCKRLGGTSVAVIGACMYIFQDIDAGMCEEFFERLADGEGLPAGDPILMLRNRLLQNNAQRSETPTFIVQAWIIKMWNAFRQDQPVSQVSYRSIGTNPEEFPKPI